MASRLVWHLSDTSNHSAAFPPSDPLSAACWCFFLLIIASGSQRGFSSFRLHICVLRGKGKANLSQMPPADFVLYLIGQICP